MSKVAVLGVLTGALALSACSVAPPTGPSIAAMPGAGKTYEQFLGDDARCRQNAAVALGPRTPGQAATQSAVGSAAVGTGLGAAVGALAGAAGGAAGVGAAAGAGAGLLAGSAIGANTAQASAAGLQRSYDVVYAQCMAAAGEKVPDPTAPPPYYPSYGYAYPAYPYPAYAYPPVVYPPVSIGLGFRFGGWRRW